MGTLHEDISAIKIISRCIPLRMRNVLDESCSGNQNTDLVTNNFPPPENRAIYEIACKILVELDRPQMLL